MRSHVFVENIKFLGCATTIINKVETIPSISNVEVNIEAGKVSFNCEHDTCRLKVISSLKKWGYPLSASEANFGSS